MRDATLNVWDGIRPRSRRTVVARREMQIGALGVTTATETLAEPTDWAFDEDHHAIVVHLGGRLDRMECEFSAGPSGRAIPAPGDIWMIPAACRYAALAQGERAEFIELRVPTALLADAPLPARMQHRDEALAAAAARLAALVARGGADDLAAMAATAVAADLQSCLAARYAGRGVRATRRGLSASDRTRLAEAVRDELDAQHSLASLAALVGMDVRRFTGAFHQAFHLSPWQYVLRARLEEAARLLRGTDEPVTGIGLAVGFATPSHFATAFARRFGVPPSRYRSGGRR